MAEPTKQQQLAFLPRCYLLPPVWVLILIVQAGAHASTFTHGLADGPESVPLAFPVYARHTPPQNLPPGPRTPSSNVIAWHIKPGSKNRA